MRRVNKSSKKTKPSLVAVFLIMTIDLYRFFFGPFVRNIFGISNKCRYSTTCSQYAKQMIVSQGITKGAFLAAKRIVACR